MHPPEKGVQSHPLPSLVRARLTVVSSQASPVRAQTQEEKAFQQEKTCSSDRSSHVMVSLGKRAQLLQSSSCSSAAFMASRSLASPSAPGLSAPASELNFESISASMNFSGSRAPRDSRDRTANRRSSSIVGRSSPIRDSGPNGTATGARSRRLRGVSRSVEIDPGFTTKDPGECSRHSATTPRLLSNGSKERIASLTGETPPGL